MPNDRPSATTVRRMQCSSILMHWRVLSLCMLLLPAACVSDVDDGEEGDDVAESEEALTSHERRAALFQHVDDSSLTPTQRAAVLAKYASIQHEGVREDLYEKAVLFYDKNRGILTNERWLGIIDFSLHSRERRFAVIDMNGGPVRKMVVSHGSGSDTNDDGVATRFSNVRDSHMSSLGFYAVAEVYTGSHGRSLKLDGLSSTNSNARRRSIVIHEANYVNVGASRQGRSQGCPAIDHDDRAFLLGALRDGAILYASD